MNPAFADHKLSVEAAKQLVEMIEDDSIPVHFGQELPTISASDFLKSRAKLESEVNDEEKSLRGRER